MDPRSPSAMLRASLDGIASEAMRTLRIRGVRLVVGAATLGAVCVDAAQQGVTLTRTAACLCDAVTCIAGALGHRDVVDWIVATRIDMQRAPTMPAPAHNDSSNEMEASR